MSRMFEYLPSHDIQLVSEVGMGVHGYGNFAVGWCHHRVCVEFCSWSWYADFEVFYNNAQHSLCYWYCLKLSVRGPLMFLCSCLGGFTTWCIIIIMSSILPTHPTDCCVLHRCLPLYLPSPVHNCAITSATAVPWTDLSWRCLIFPCSSPANNCVHHRSRSSGA
jgi:hypothetical protein